MYEVRCTFSQEWQIENEELVMLKLIILFYPLISVFTSIINGFKFNNRACSVLQAYAQLEILIIIHVILFRRPPVVGWEVWTLGLQGTQNGL